MNPIDTLNWLRRAADDPVLRHRSRLPESLDLREHAPLFTHVAVSAHAGTELGFPLVLKPGGLSFPPALATQPRYDAVIDGGRFVGTFHVHPGDRPPFFDPQDLASALRSDNPGFVALLIARDRLYALVRSNPYLYISAHHVNRNPLLLSEAHFRILRARGGEDTAAPGYEEAYRRAGLYWFHRYQLALYEGLPSHVLNRTVTPHADW